MFFWSGFGVLASCGVTGWGLIRVPTRRLGPQLSNRTPTLAGGIDALAAGWAGAFGLPQLAGRGPRPGDSGGQKGVSVAWPGIWADRGQCVGQNRAICWPGLNYGVRALSAVGIHCFRSIASNYVTWTGCKWVVLSLLLGFLLVIG